MTQAPEVRDERPVVIAHRGAAGYLPEHTLLAKALAYGMEADYIEQDVVLTRDNRPVVMHDIHLDTVTNVAERFPKRNRPDGRYYAVDFTLSEIQLLQVNSRLDLGTGLPVYPDRQHLASSVLRVPDLEAEIQLIQGLNRTMGRDVGLYTEIKAPAWHRQQGKDITAIVLSLLKRYGYQQPEDRIYLQCFDAAENHRMRHELGCRLKIVQLIGEKKWNEADTDFRKLRTPAGVEQIARYADGIGPWLPHVVEGVEKNGQPIVTPLVAEAHHHGLVVHPYTFRADDLPAYADSFEQLLRIFVDDAGVDGVFTDFPDQAVRYLRRAEEML